MLPGLMSRWITPLRCAWASAEESRRFQVEAQTLHGNPLRRRVVDKTYGQAGGQGVQYGFHGIRPDVVAQEHRRLVAFQDKGPASGGILLAGAVKPLDRGARVTATNPFIVGPELETGQSWVLLDGVYGRHQLFDVNAIDKG